MKNFEFSEQHLAYKAICIALVGSVIAFGVLAYGMYYSISTRSLAVAELEYDINTRQRRMAGGETSDVNLDDMFYTQKTPQLAQAALQTQLQDIAKANSVAIEILRAGEINYDGDLIQLDLTMNGVAPEENVGEFLLALSTARPMVSIHKYSLAPARRSRSDPVRKLSFEMKLRGYMKRQEG